MTAEKYLEVLELGYFEVQFAFEGLADENVWKRPAAGLISVGELAGHIAYWEAVRLAGFTAPEAERLFGRPPDDHVPHVEPLPAHMAQERYLARFHVLAEATELEPGPAAFATE